MKSKNFSSQNSRKKCEKSFTKIFSEKCQSDLTFYCDHVDPNGVKCDYSTQIKRHLVTHKVSENIYFRRKSRFNSFGWEIKFPKFCGFSTENPIKRQKPQNKNFAKD